MKSYGKIRKRRKFYGKMYNYFAKKTILREAKKIAKEQRKKGHNVKVTKDVFCHYDNVGDYLCDQVYVVYVRRK